MREVFFVLPPNLLLVDMAGPADALRLACRFGADLRVHYVGPAASIATSAGLALADIAALPACLPDQAWIIVPGTVTVSSDAASAATQEMINWLARQVDVSRHQLATICSGALLAAKAGLLTARQCTTHQSLLEELAVLVPSAQVLSNRVFVQDGNVCTSAGVTAGLDMVLHLLAQFAGPQLATRVAQHMVVYFRRSPQDPELSPWLAHRNHLHRVVHQVQDILIADPARGWSVEALAAQVHVSARHLSRLFRLHTGLSVHDYHHSLRCALAEQWQRSGLSKEKAALAAGFSSARQLKGKV
ncbi:DJ-1/PfpI family protein [Neisseriaceae bacterium TC5R-5]|nr:DJ-1/PfpI family protein [Neisseriaceae bacterium TC5R-5]